MRRMNSTLIIAIGGIIILMGTALSIYGAYRQGIESSEQTNRIEETLDRETNNLSYPLPSELKCTDLIVTIKPEGLNKYLPALREKFNSDSLLKQHHGKGEFLNVNFPLKPKEVNDELIETFQDKEIHISLQIGDEKGPFNNENRKLVWTFNARTSLDDANTHLLYFLDYENEQKEYFRFSLGNGKRIDSNGELRLFSGLKSALELCGQTVHLSFQIGNNQTLFPPIISIKHLAFRDNNSKDYYIEFDGFTTVRHSNEGIMKRSPDLKIAPYHDVIFLTGKIKCSSF